MDDNRSWVSLEIAADKLSCSGDKVRSLIKAGRLQGKTDSVGGRADESPRRSIILRPVAC
jgi:hypothetical protein